MCVNYRITPDILLHQDGRRLSSMDKESNAQTRLFCNRPSYGIFAIVLISSL